MSTAVSTESVTNDHESMSAEDELRRELQRSTPRLKGVHSGFKSPLQTLQSSKVCPEVEVAELQRRKEQLDSEIALLETEGYNIEELECHIDKMHEYNDIKDTGQSLLGRIAALRGTTTGDLYSHFGLELED